MKNLARLKMLNDEMLMRASPAARSGLSEDAALQKALSVRAGRILVVDDHPAPPRASSMCLRSRTTSSLERDPQTPP